MKVESKAKAKVLDMLYRLWLYGTAAESFVEKWIEVEEEAYEFLVEHGKVKVHDED